MKKLILYLIAAFVAISCERIDELGHPSNKGREKLVMETVPNPYSLECTKVYGRYLMRCENKEVVCYNDSYDGTLACNFKN